MSRQEILSGSPFEQAIGFARAVRVGSVIAVSGTAPIASDGSTACPGDVYGQTQCCLRIILDAVQEAGGRREDVIRTRVMLTDASRWQEAAKAHSEVFGEVRPACTFVEVSRLINTEWLVEVEADCCLQKYSGSGTSDPDADH